MRDADKALFILLPATFFFYVITFYVIGCMTKQIEDMESRIVDLERLEAIYVLFDKGDLIIDKGTVKEAGFLTKDIKFYD